MTTALSHDYSSPDYVDKHYTRTLPYIAMRELSCHLVDDDGVLLYDWIELAGRHAPTAAYLLEQGALQPGWGKYVGVDRDPQILNACQVRYPADTSEWYNTSLTAALKAHTRPVGCLVYDSEDGLNMNANTLRYTLYALLNYALEQKQDTGEFCLVLNYYASPHLRGGKGNWQKYLAMLREVFGPHVQHPFRLSTLRGSDGTSIPVYSYRSTGAQMLWVMIRL